MYVAAPTTAVYTGSAANGGYFVTEKYCGIISILIAFFFGPCGWFIFMCPVDERQRWVTTTTSTTVVMPQQPQYAQPQYAQPQVAQPQPQYAQAQPVQAQPVQAQPAYQQQPTVAQPVASAPPAY